MPQSSQLPQQPPERPLAAPPDPATPPPRVPPAQSAQPDALPRSESQAPPPQDGVIADSAVPGAGRPRYFPSAWAWLRTGMGRNRWGVAAALVSTYSGLPLAIYVGVVAGAVAGIGGGLGGFGFVRSSLPLWVLELPLLGPALNAFLPNASGVLGAMVGTVIGLVLGFAGTLGSLWWRPFTEDPLDAAGSVLGWVAFGLFIGLLYTVIWVAFEPTFLRLRGARRMSRREQALLMPILQSCVEMLRLENHPYLLVDDSHEPNAVAYTRHIVVTQGLLDEFRYDREVVAGVLCHELVHWRNADPVGSAFVRGIALPLYLIYNGARSLAERVDRSRSAFVLWLPLFLLRVLTWPITLTVRYVLMPLQARGVREAEYRADRGAVLGGYRGGLRRALTRMRRTFEGGRSGWDQAVCSTHPPNELRLERLEDPSRRADTKTD